MFYQQVLKEFGAFKVCRIVKPVKIVFDFGASEVWKKTRIPLDLLPQMLDEYFSIQLEIRKVENKASEFSDSNE